MAKLLLPTALPGVANAHCYAPSNRYATLTAPTDVTATTSDVQNVITVTWTASDAAYYWIYCNTTNDSSTATKKVSAYESLYVSNGTGSYDCVFEESGTYYFWVKAADGSLSSSGTSDFSDSASCAFTYTELTAPTNLTAQSNGSTSYPGIKLSWTSTGSAYYHIYWNTENNSSTATKLSYFCSTNSYTIYDNVYDMSSGTTYYFWV